MSNVAVSPATIMTNMVGIHGLLLWNNTPAKIFPTTPTSVNAVKHTLNIVNRFSKYSEYGLKVELNLPA